MKLNLIAKRVIVLLLTVILISGCIAPCVAKAYGSEETTGQLFNAPGNGPIDNNSILPSVSTISDSDTISDAENAYRERMQQEHAKAILAESKIADYVNTADFLETKPMFRLEALEKLNTYVVQNADNTNTVYIMSENVKYIDKSGKIREKDIALTASEKGYSVTDSDVKLLLPLKLSDGIDVNTDFGSLSLIPQLRAESAAKFNEKSNSVLYSGAFGSGSSLRYTPTLSGVKEDIILETRSEENSFEFRMETQGLYLAEEDGIYYLVSTDNKDSRIRLNQIYIYDANGRFTAGEMSVIDEGRGKFLLTVAAPREFLDDANTAYPVVIDPSFTINTNQYSSNIIDAAVHQNKPNMNAGTWQYDNIGYTDSTYGLARTVIKLSALLSDSTYQSLTASQINSVTFSAMEATGNSSKTVKLHPITGTPTWTESTVTWNNYGSFDTTVNYGGALTGDQRTSFNITNLVKAWKNGSYNGNGCFIFIMGGTENSQCRALYSMEYSGTTNRPYVSMTYQANVSFTSYSIYVNEGSVVLPDCNVSPTGTYSYSWSVNNNSIATCTWVNSPTTMLTGLHAGMTELNVTVTDSSNVAIGSATAMVFVLKPDGIYNISNVYYSGKLLSVGKTLSDEMDVFVRGVTYSSNDPITDQITQMWRIKHVVYNIYTFRPYYKLDMRMGRDDDNTVIVGDAGMEDTYNYQLSDYFWWITWDESEKYTIRCDNTTNYLTAASEQALETPVYAQSNSNPGMKAKWNFTNVTSTAPTGVYLYDLAEESIIITTTRDIFVGTTKSLTTMQVSAVAYSVEDISQAFTWGSSNNAIATVDSNGEVTGISSGKATINGRIYRNNAYHYVSYTVYAGFSFESTINNLEELYNVALEYNSTPYNAALLTLQFIRRIKYTGSAWNTVAGAVDSQFVYYVETYYPSLYDIFTVDNTENYYYLDPNSEGYVDFTHLCATMNGLLYDSVGFQAALAGEWNINNLCGWAGDLQTLCIDVLEFTNNSNVYSVIYNATYSIIGNEAYSLSMMDLLADTDAYNVYQLLNSSSSNLIDAFTTYYDDYVGTRYTQFTNGWGKQRIYNCVRNYTTNILFLWIDWPLLEGYNITDTQADAIAWAFTDFIWEKIQNE